MAIGYACVHIGSEATKLSALRLANASADNIRSVIEKNLAALLAMMQYNVDHEIKLFRISSDIIPLASHPAMKVDWRSEYRETLTLIGEYCRNHAIRVSMHPGQYTVLNSPNAEVTQRAAEELLYHSDFLDALGCDAACKIVIHTGGVYGDKMQAMARFIKNYSVLNENIKARLVIENDDQSYTAEDVLLISRQTGMPVVFDYLHHILNPSQSDLSPFAWIDICGGTWSKKDGRQKVHYSQSATGAARGAHTKTIDSHEFLNFFNGMHDQTIDIMLEVKDKNLSAVKCILLTKDSLKIRELEEEWARYKYLVLSRSASIYNTIRTLLKHKSKPDAQLFYTYIDKALALSNEEKGAQVNALQHMWGYVGKNADAKDQKRFSVLLAEYQQEKKSSKALKNLLFRLAKKQGENYLLESLYFYI
jgi:UV DNA damage endonuclease